MVLDIADNLVNNDIELLNSDKYRAYNLLEKRFEDNSGIGLKIYEMIKMGLNTFQIESILLQYLSQFSVVIEKFSIKTKKDGSVIFDCKFREDEYV